jgi:hypothetical protein
LKKICVLSFIMALLLSIYYIPGENLQAKTNPAVKEQSLEVGLENAKLAALNHLEQSVYSDEIDSVDDLELKTNLYDVDDTLLGYYFTYKTTEDKTNYILVSASLDRAPILQHGGGQLDYEYDYLLNEGKKLYYLGPLQFLYGKNKNEVNEKFNQRKIRWIKELEKENKTLTPEYEKVKKKEIPRIRKDAKHIDEWNKLLSYDPQNTFTIAATTYRLLGVTRLWQRSSGVSSPNSACGPTTAAMVSNYLKGQGFNVKGVSNYSSTGSFINHMYSELGTTFAGTSINQYISGLNTHLEHNYTNNKWSTWTYRAYGYYAHYKDNINNNKPVGLRFDFWIKEGTYIDYHFVAGIGYYHGSVAEFAIKDPDGGSGNTEEIWLEWNKNNDDMAMGLVNNTY